MSVLSLWTVYDHPLDYPDKFVARRFDVDKDGSKPTPSLLVSSDLDALREVLQFEMHLTCMVRDPSDDPKILETWL